MLTARAAGRRAPRERSRIVGVRLRLGLVGDYVRGGDLRNLAGKATKALYSDIVGIGIRKDLTADRGAADRRREPPIRPASMADVLAMVGDDRGGAFDADELHERRWRRRVAKSMGVEGCFVADVEGIGPAFMQYLFLADDNDRLRSTFPGAFPDLAADEALVEYLYVVPAARHPGLAVSCVAQVAEEARQRGAASVISFIDPGNKGAIFVSQMTGFRAYCVRRTRSRFFRKTYVFEPWPAGLSATLVDLVNGRVKIT